MDMKVSLKRQSLALFSLLSTLPLICLAQQNAAREASELFKGAAIRTGKAGQSTVDVRFLEGSQMPVSSFFQEYQQALGLSRDNDFRLFKVFKDKLGQTHHRFKQFYKGVELAEVQFLLHEKEGAVVHGHGNPIHGLDLEVRPSLTEEQALRHALSHLNAQSYMWQNKANESHLKKEQNDANATYYPKGELKISTGRLEMVKENFRLVYRFDIYSEKPLGRYYVDVDASTGEIVNTISRRQHSDVRGQGLSVYNGVVPITVNDALTSTIIASPHGHLNPWNAFGNSGVSWWIADPALGNRGGYHNYWYEVLDTDPVVLTGANPKLTFYHRYSVEEPGNEPGEYDAWDGMNVRISTATDTAWRVLTNPVPQYNSASLYSFGFDFGEGPGVPGWTGAQHNWTQVTFDLSSYEGQTVRLRFAFASDPTISTNSGAPELYGWQIDDLKVSSSAGVLYANDGAATGIATRNLAPEVKFVPGKYRLREAGRGAGISTYDAHNGSDLPAAVDFVDADSSFTEPRAQAGVSVHWAVAATYDYYLARHGRNSFDDAGARMISYVHYDDNWTNAVWDGLRMGFGDGPGNQAPHVSIDIVAHEFTHGVNQYTADLIYLAESGALNESFSDIFAAAVEFSTPGVTGSWLVGDISIPFRSLSDPKTFRDPDTYLGQFWISTADTFDNGGVHTNSGVQNHWFYLLSAGGSGINDNNDAYSVTGLGIEQAAQIAYRNLSVYLAPTSEYRDARLGSLYSARDLFGHGSMQYQAVQEAWHAVGVDRPYLDPAIIANADTLSFMAEVATTSDTAELRVANYGIEILRIDTLLISSAAFHLVAMPDFPIELQYEESFSLKVVFSPVEEGESRERLTILSTDPFHSSKTISLRAQGYVIHPASEGIMYAVTGRSANGNLLTLNPNSGIGTSVGASGHAELTGVTVRRSNGELYGTIAGSAATTLVRIDAQSGAAYQTATIPVGHLRAIAFDGNGDLYAARFTNGDLFRIDPATGGTAFIGATRLSLLSGLAINPVDGALWGARAGNAIYRINKATAEAVAVGNTGFNQTVEIEFDAQGKLFGLTGLGANTVNELIQIDPATATGRMIGATGFKTVLGLAMRGAITTSVQMHADESVPGHYELHQNFPNPFNPSTSIRYDLPKASHVILKIYDLAGHEIRTLVNGKQTSGRKFMQWDGRNENGEPISSGVYIYLLRAGDYTMNKKMLLVR